MHIRKQIYYNHSSREDYYYYYFLQISKQSRYFNIKILRYILFFFFAQTACLHFRTFIRPDKSITDRTGSARDLFLQKLILHEFLHWRTSSHNWKTI